MVTWAQERRDVEWCLGSLSDARQPEVDFLHSWAVVSLKIFSQIVSFRVKKQRSTNFISSRRVEREKDSLPVDVCRLCLSSLFSAFETIGGHFSHRNKWAMALPFRLKKYHLSVQSEFSCFSMDLQPERSFTMCYRSRTLFVMMKASRARVLLRSIKMVRKACHALSVIAVLIFVSIRTFWKMKTSSWITCLWLHW